MTDNDIVGTNDSSSRSPHRIEIDTVELVGGGRTIVFKPGLNIIQGPIGTGKTTLVLLLRALLGAIPDGLPPEVDRVSAIRGLVRLGERVWNIYRPRTTSTSAYVEIVQESAPGTEGVAIRIPVVGKETTYSLFLLDQLSIPAVSVPQAKSRPSESVTPVSISDWLGYCIVPGSEIDTQVFGHEHPFRNAKRRWVFELAYGFYNPEEAVLAARMRAIELRLDGLDREEAVREKFLADTPFSDVAALRSRIAEIHNELARLRQQQASIGSAAMELTGVGQLRERLLDARRQLAELVQEVRLLDAQIADLSDLRSQLVSQSERLTRAVIADEWLVDFDFVVCPRCGSDVDASRGTDRSCYLCLQEPRRAPSRDDLISEQNQIANQVRETDEVIEQRRVAASEARAAAARLQASIDELSAELDHATASYVSDTAQRIADNAAAIAKAESELGRLGDYLNILERQESSRGLRSELEVERDALAARIDALEVNRLVAEANVRALEERMLQYLEELHMPDLGAELSVRINRSTYLPEISGRRFDRLSSQGMKTLVNVAHALAHHTVAIDRHLPLPGLLVLDGISSNVGSEGFDQDRISDVYRLLAREASTYRNDLQIIAVDNEVPRQILMPFLDSIVLTMSQQERLIRPAESGSGSADRDDEANLSDGAAP